MSTAVETVNLKTPQELYLDWEHAHWAAPDVDLARDPKDWASPEAIGTVYLGRRLGRSMLSPREPLGRGSEESGDETRGAG